MVSRMFAVAVTGLLATPAVASAQATGSGGRAALTEAAKALGMVRGLERSLTIVNMFEYTANGTMADSAGAPSEVKRITAAYDYVIPAARVDVEKAGQRTIEVAAGSLAWDEATPGIYLRPADRSE